MLNRRKYVFKYHAKHIQMISLICLMTLQISLESSKVFVEITSHTSMKDCVATMEALLVAMLHAGFGASQNEAGDSVISTLNLRQVKVADADGNLRRVYPAKGDLVFNESEHIAVTLQ